MAANPAAVHPSLDLAAPYDKHEVLKVIASLATVVHLVQVVQLGKARDTALSRAKHHRAPTSWQQVLPVGAEQHRRPQLAASCGAACMAPPRGGPSHAEGLSPKRVLPALQERRSTETQKAIDQ